MFIIITDFGLASTAHITVLGTVNASK